MEEFMLVCLNCGVIYKDSILKHLDDDSTCFMNNCIFPVVNIDDIFVDIMIKFNSLGSITKFSCSGHMFEHKYLKFSPYVYFGVPVYAENMVRFDVTKILDIIQNECKEISSENYGYTEVGDVDGGFIFTISSDSFDSVDSKIDAQGRFLKYLYEIYNRTIYKLNNNS